MAKSSQGSGVGPALAVTSLVVLLGGAAAYVYYTRDQVVLVDDDNLDDEPASSGGVKTTTTTTTTTTTGDTEETVTKEEAAAAEAKDPKARSDREQERESAQNSPETQRREEEQGVKVKDKINFKKGDNSAILYNYKLTGESGSSYKTKDGFSSNPFDQLYFSHTKISTVVPRLGLATDIREVSTYKPLAGMVSGSPVERNRRGNRKLIAQCLGCSSNASVDEINDKIAAITNLTKERLACVVYDVVCAIDKYWELRKESIASKYEKYSLYVFKGNRPSDTKKGSGGQEDARKELAKLFDLDANPLEKQRIAAATLWAIMQASDDKNVGRLNNDLKQRGFEDKDSPNMSNPNSRINEGIKEAISHMTTINLPASQNVMCANRKYRALVDAFFDGCFNCETPQTRALYVDRPASKRQMRDAKLTQQGNLQILSGLVLHSNNHPGRNRTPKLEE